jgi:hypothetical protein
MMMVLFPSSGETYTALLDLRLTNISMDQYYHTPVIQATPGKGSDTLQKTRQPSSRVHHFVQSKEDGI